MSEFQYPDINAQTLQRFMLEVALDPSQKLRELRQWADAKCAEAEAASTAPAPEKPKRSGKKAA